MDAIFQRPIMTDISAVTLHLSEICRAQLDSSWQAENVCSPYARVYVVLEGRGTLTEKDRQTVLRQGRAYLVPTGTRFSYACDSYLDKFFFHLNVLGRDGLDVLQNLRGIHEIACPSAIAQRIEDAYQSKGLSAVLTLKSIVAELLAQLLATYPPCTLQPAYSATVAAAVSMVKKNIGTQLKTADIAKELYISESTLHKRFKAETGFTIGQYTDQLIFFYASVLLAQTEDSVKSISDRLGFCDQFYFARRFKERMHSTPTAYRRLAKMENPM